MTEDTLSAVLRAVRLQGAVFFQVRGSPPWVAEAPAASEVGPSIMPGVDHVIEYHVVTAGACWGALVGGPAVRLETGDVIVFPQGDAHVISSAPGMRGRPDPDQPRRAMTRGLPIAITLGGDGPGRAEVACGFLGCDARPFNPLLGALPRLLHLPAGERPDPVVEQFIRLALAESDQARAGGQAMLARLSELLFVEVVRRHLAGLPPGQVGWLAGLRDESVGRVLGTLHARPAHGWSLDRLAREVGLSRSVLAERFTRFVGVPPMQYLAQWRMQLAASQLAGSALGLAEIADRVGYGSEAALSRAFKRWVGMAPADWRRTRRGAAEAPPAP